MKLIYFGADAPWTKLLNDGFRRRNTHLLKSFANSGFYEQVIAVHFATRGQVLKSILDKKIKDAAVSDVFVANILPVGLKGTFFTKINSAFFKLQIWLQGVRKFNQSENIIFCYWPKGYDLSRNVALKGRTFFDTDHNIIHDENLNKKQQDWQEKLLLDAGKNCEKVLSSTRSMLDWYAERGFSNVYRLRNGIIPEIFMDLPEPKKQFSQPIIGYIGTISKWIDYEAFEALIKNNPQWDFPIYGPSFKTETYKNLEAFKNVNFMGPVKADDVPATLKTFDVALNLYRNQPWLDVDSMKLYEYIAAGVPVVSLNYHPFLGQDFENILYLAENAAEMEVQIKKILEVKKSGDSGEKFMMNSTWDKRVEKFHKDVIRKS
jgi:glycosyltransferase involved in cell wall biosynthesis